ncbi:CCA tRNA nucleotidyltransferase [Sporosarcina sp. 179-K 3D1 HS]|uniref:CCA tRNA nucleotidyltransferase n=1 Tax=Sporosarcina sp. 179-K 3D1 HS TaxID=3232169 RepID=UPI00399F1BDB
MIQHFGTAAGRKVISALEREGYEAVFVGGSVRDHLLGKPAKDFDIATSAEPTEVKAIFPSTVDVGIAHGTVLVLIDGEAIEVTTYRTEGTYSDHRHPDEVRFVRSLQEDLARRDFTINALAVTLEGELIDLFGGKNDLEQGMIRAIGEAAERFNEDALRMIRAIRFAAVLDFTIDEKTCHAIREQKALLRHVAVERIKAEMDKLFTGVNPGKAFDYAVHTQLREDLPLFPQDSTTLGKTAPYETALEGWASLMAVGNFGPSEMVRAYKLSNREKQFLHAVDDMMEKRKVRPYTVEDFYTYPMDVLIVCEKLVRKLMPGAEPVSFEEMERRKCDLPIRSKAELTVRGSDLISWAGVRGGQWTGEWLQKIESAVLHGKCINDPDDIKGWFLNEFNREE